MKPPFGMYQTEAMIYLHANRLYHVLPLVSTKRWFFNYQKVVDMRRKATVYALSETSHSI